jgi:hypothetical protein
VGIATGYGLNGRGSNPGKENIFSYAQRLDRLCGPPSLLSNVFGGSSFPGGKTGRDVKLTSHLHLVPRSRMVELYLLSHTCLHGIVLNYIIKYRDNLLTFANIMKNCQSIDNLLRGQTD